MQFHLQPDEGQQAFSPATISIVFVRRLNYLFNRSMIRDLAIKGEWKYKNEGILDDTHLRFFTRKSILEMFNENGFEVEQIVPRLFSRSRLINRLTLGFLKEFLTLQYIIKAGRKA